MPSLDEATPPAVEPATTPAAPACADVTYHVTAKNTTRGELSMTELSDEQLGSLTTVHDAVSSTTCAPGTIAADETYECDVTAQLCGDSQAGKPSVTLGGGDGDTTERDSTGVSLSMSETKQP
jgi:hypothetical protein